MKINLELIQYINYFEKTTRSKVKDCFFEDQKLIFIVQPGQARIAIGKQGININKYFDHSGISLPLFHTFRSQFVVIENLTIQYKEILNNDMQILKNLQKKQEKK